MDDKIRFWAKVAKRGPDECWLWVGKKNQKGYGQMEIDGRQFTAHRLAYQWEVADIPSGCVVRHRCDNPSCVNPSHLLAGTQADNIADRNSRGRQAKGEQSGRSKLTKEQVLEIRASSLGNVALARKYGVSDTHIRYIRKRHPAAWAWLPEATAV
jgi:hypothetical protein